MDQGDLGPIKTAILVQGGFPYQAIAPSALGEFIFTVRVRVGFDKVAIKFNLVFGVKV